MVDNKLKKINKLRIYLEIDITFYKMSLSLQKDFMVDLNYLKAFILIIK